MGYHIIGGIILGILLTFTLVYCGLNFEFLSKLAQTNPIAFLFEVTLITAPHVFYFIRNLVINSRINRYHDKAPESKTPIGTILIFAAPIAVFEALGIFFLIPCSLIFSDLFTQILLQTLLFTLPALARLCKDINVFVNRKLKSEQKKRIRSHDVQSEEESEQNCILDSLCSFTKVQAPHPTESTALCQKNNTSTTGYGRCIWRILKFTFDITALVIIALACIALTYIISERKDASWTMVAGIICLSIAFTPNFWDFEKFKDIRANEADNLSFSIVTSAICSLLIPSLSLVSLSTPLIPVKYTLKTMFTNYSDYAEYLDWDLFLSVLGNIVFGVLAFELSYSSIAIKNMYCGFVIPMVIAPLITLFIVFATCFPDTDYFGEWIEAMTGVIIECPDPSEIGYEFLILCGLVLLPIWICRNCRKEIPMNPPRHFIVFPLQKINTLIPWCFLLLNRPMYKSRQVIEAATVKKKQFVNIPLYNEDKRELKGMLVSVLSLLLKPLDQKVVDLNIDQYIITFAVDGGKESCGTKLSKIALLLPELLSKLLDKAGAKLNIIGEYDKPFGRFVRYEVISGGVTPLYPTYINILIKDSREDFEPKVLKGKRISMIFYLDFVRWYIKTNHWVQNHCYILFLDGDIVFKPESFAILVKKLNSDSKVGVVCGRVHPISKDDFNLLVWFQKFEYAISHWLTKASESVFGSVTCAPGCYSLYRSSELFDIYTQLKGKDLLKQYGKEVDNGTDFLKYEMGEDRLLCTLLLCAGTLIKYCPLANSDTHCPRTFQGLFLQRRRWIVSTFANMNMIIFSKFSEIRTYHPVIGILFMIVQFFTVLSSVIGPSVVLLVISNGLDVIFPNSFLSLLILIFSIIFYCLVLLYLPVSFFSKLEKHTEFTFLFIKVYCIFFNILMAGVWVALVFEIFADPTSSTALFMYALVAIIVFSGLMNPSEAGILVHGVTYMFLIPSAYMLLPLYAICYMVDQSWGTRDVSNSIAAKSKNSFSSIIKSFSCCLKKIGVKDEENIVDNPLEIQNEKEEKYQELKKDILAKVIALTEEETHFERDTEELIRDLRALGVFNDSTIANNFQDVKRNICIPLNYLKNKYDETMEKNIITFRDNLYPEPNKFKIDIAGENQNNVDVNKEPNAENVPVEKMEELENHDDVDAKKSAEDNKEQIPSPEEIKKILYKRLVDCFERFCRLNIIQSRMDHVEKFKRGLDKLEENKKNDVENSIKKEKTFNKHASILKSTLDTIDEFNKFAKIPAEEKMDIYFMNIEELKKNYLPPREKAGANTQEEIDREIEDRRVKINIESYEFWDELSIRYTPKNLAKTKKDIGKGLKELRSNYLVTFLSINLIWILISVGVDVFELSICTSQSNCGSLSTDCQKGFHCCVEDSVVKCCPDEECYNILGLIFLAIFGFLLIIQFVSAIFFSLETLIAFSIPQLPSPKSPWKIKTD